MAAFVGLVDRLFADPNLGRDAVYEPAEDPPVAVRVIEVASPRPGDRIILDGEAFVVQGEPVRDRERLVWTIEVRPE